ncbi:NADP-dependent oxidoreductase domain-containing protein [Mrakia frigida]|uniref:aldo/keto reductase n=1 Tax=Mrakia frigida TaxID=29902 RepID=UPI003FCBEFB4
MPVFGLGTWLAKPGEVEEATFVALESGYTHIDAALIYQNEAEVGNGIKRWQQKSGKSRDDIWVTSKLWNNAHQPSEVPGALETSLKDLQLEYLDLYLIHWPAPMLPNKGALSPQSPEGVPLVDRSVTLGQTWAAMEDLLATGKVRNIGISNMIQSEVEEILKTAKHVPDAIQLEIHPFLQQAEYVKWLQSKGIVVTAYSPFGNLNPTYAGKISEEGRIVDHPVVKELAEKYGKTTSQVVLSWGIGHDLAVIPKSSNPTRIKENIGVFTFSPEDLKKLDAIDIATRYNDPSENFGYPFFSNEKDAELVKKQMVAPLA